MVGRTSDASKTAALAVSRAFARNIASSGAEYFILQVKGTPTLRGTFSVSSILGGAATVTLADWRLGSNDSVRLTSVGKYNGVQDSTVACLVAGVGAPTITGAVMLSSGANAKIAQSGSSIINGKNHNLSGNLDNSHPAVAGIAVSNNANLTDVTVGVSMNVSGSAGTFPDVQVNTQTPNILPYVDSWLPKAVNFVGQSFTSSNPYPNALGTAASPQITHVTGKADLKSGAIGYGILIVDNGDAAFSSGSGFYGLVVLRGGSTVKMSFSGDAFVIGAAVVYGDEKTQCNTSGTSAVKYSWQAIENYLKPLSSGGGVTVANWSE